MKNYHTVLLALILSCLNLSGFAHTSSTSYLRLDAKGQHADVELEVALQDLEIAVGLDLNQDGKITWSELSQQETAISSYLQKNITLSQNDSPCEWQGTNLWVNNRSDGSYAHFKWRLLCPKTISTLRMHYQALFAYDPQHRSIGIINQAQGTQTYVVNRKNPIVMLQTQHLQPWQEFRQYLREGAWHIWIGYDHVVFLLSLLLPSVLRRESGHWVAVGNFKQVFWDVVKLVTAFSLAHSLTLALSGLGIVQLPVALIEATIAATIIVTALNNLVPLVKHSHRWVMVLLFGLIHGFGFANVLHELNLSANSVLWVLLSFNLGVELGQLVIVTGVLPVIYLLRQKSVYRTLIYPASCAAMMGLGFFWLVQRLA